MEIGPLQLAVGDPLPPLFLDHTEAWRAEKKFLETELPPYIRVWMTGPPVLSEGLDQPLGSLSSDVFERRTSTGNRLFAHLSRASEQIFGQIVPLRIKTLGNTNTVA